MDDLQQIEELGLRLGMNVYRPMTRQQTIRLFKAGLHEGIAIHQMRRFLDWNENIQVTKRRRLQANS